MVDISGNPAPPAASAAAAQPPNSTTPPGAHKDMDAKKTISLLDSQ